MHASGRLVSRMESSDVDLEDSVQIVCCIDVPRVSLLHEETDSRRQDGSLA